MKIIPIPEKIHGDVKAHLTVGEDLNNQIRKLQRKKSLNKEKLWDLLGDHIPETDTDNCTIDEKAMVIKVGVNDPRVSIIERIFGINDDHD